MQGLHRIIKERDLPEKGAEGTSCFATYLLDNSSDRIDRQSSRRTFPLVGARAQRSYAVEKIAAVRFLSGEQDVTILPSSISCVCLYELILEASSATKNYGFVVSNHASVLF